MKKVIREFLKTVAISILVFLPFASYVGYKELMHRHVHFRTGQIVVVYQTQVDGKMEHIICLRNNPDIDYMSQDYWYSQFIITEQDYHFLSNELGSIVTAPERSKIYLQNPEFPKILKFSSR